MRQRTLSDVSMRLMTTCSRSQTRSPLTPAMRDRRTVLSGPTQACSRLESAEIPRASAEKGRCSSGL
jgi:hypothetical protein